MVRTRVITQVKDLPSFAQSTGRRVEQFGFTFQYVNEYPLVDLDRRVQVRNIADLAPLGETAKYAAALKRGDQFPPVIVTMDGYLVDGATRTEGARKIGWTSFPTIILDVVFEEATEGQIYSLIWLGAGFNNTHGRGMKTANLVAIIEATTEEDDSAKDIAAKLHIPESTVSMVMAGAKAKKRATGLNIPTDGLTNSHLKTFGNKSRLLSDDVFAEFIMLVQDAKLTIAATNDVARRLEALTTEKDRMRLLNSERASYREIISGGATVPSRSAKLRQSLGYLLNAENPELLVELEPSASEQHVKMLQEAAERLASVAKAQIKAENARTGTPARPVRVKSRVKQPFGV